MDLLATKQLSIRFGGLWALKEVDFQVAADQIVGLIGPNGSGKTTFFNIVSGIYRPTEGNIYLDNKDVTGFPAYKNRQLGISRTFQTSRLWWNLSVLDNVLMGLYSRMKTNWFHAVFTPRRSDRILSESVENSLAILDYFNPALVAKRNEQVKNISHIDRRRIELCRALVSDPSVLLLDEPSAGLNPEETQEMMNDIVRIKRGNNRVAVVIIEHDMAVISGVTQRVTVFNAGRKIAEGTFSEVAERPEVIEAYLGASVAHAANE